MTAIVIDKKKYVLGPEKDYQALQKKAALKPMTLKEFKKRINESIVDATNERLTENSKLIGEIEKWS